MNHLQISIKNLLLDCKVPFTKHKKIISTSDVFYFATKQNKS